MLLLKVIILSSAAFLKFFLVQNSTPELGDRGKWKPRHLFFPPLSSSVGRGPAILGGAAGGEDFLIPWAVASDLSHLCYVIARDKYNATCALLPASQAPSDLPQGMKRLLKHLCTFPWLVGTLRPGLAYRKQRGKGCLFLSNT